jgi:hypothetical protein
VLSAEPSYNQLRKTSQLSHPGHLAALPAKLRPPLAFTAPGVLCRVLMNLASFSSVRLEVTDLLNIGRADPMDGYLPGLDLAPFGGQDAGVSRRHATLFVADNTLYIRDLASINGTRVNGATLKPNDPYPLEEGDKIEFGHLCGQIDNVSFLR